MGGAEGVGGGSSGGEGQRVGEDCVRVEAVRVEGSDEGGSGGGGCGGGEGGGGLGGGASDEGAGSKGGWEGATVVVRKPEAKAWA